MRPFACWTMAGLLLLGGCAVGPDYRRPDLRLPASFGATPVAAAQPDETGAWWAAFGDPTLTGLVNRALAGNLEVEAAAARIRQAREQERIVGAARLPSLNASAQAGYTRLSENAFPPGLTALGGLPAGAGGPASPLIGLPGSDFATYQLGFDASWELDLFGARRRASEAATARTEAAVWSGRDAQVMVAAETANTYLQHQALQRRLAVADESLAAQRDLLDFLKAQAGAGLVTSLDVRRQERDLAELEAQRQGLAAERDARLHALSVLLGEPPRALAERLSGPATQPPRPPPQVPAGLPSDLLLRRPDLRAAERRLAAATADTGEAVADLYPRISLTGAAQLVSTELASLLASESGQANAAGRIALPLFDGGRRRATVRLRQAQADEALIAYRSQVLGALKGVEDALTRLDADRRRLDRLRASEAAARDAADTTLVRYRNGLVAFTDVLEARRAWLGAQDAVAQAEAAAAQDVVALYKALGGGWAARAASTAEGAARG
jgi:NodT family efflux transporter outer membrane factor (OMF) lipoprotein